MTTPDEPKGACGFFELTDNPLPHKDHEDFFKWVGICIKEWAYIEKVIFDLCSYVLKADRKHVAIIYYRTPTLEGRLALTNDLLQSIFPKKAGEHDNPKLVIWTKIFKEIRNLAPARNVLAHSPIRYKVSIKAQIDKTGQPAKVINQESWIEIATSENERLKTGEDKSYRVDDLPKYHAAVRALWDRLLNFHNDLRVRLRIHFNG